MIVQSLNEKDQSELRSWVWDPRAMAPQAKYLGIILCTNSDILEKKALTKLVVLSSTFFQVNFIF